ncbi:anaphase-promoting complex subunit 11 RING-H2 finger-domain containing protein [Nitzschia inconspicua]|uniref:Anaphase-promoting complex subunit 11 RING-H2 finger-domain containing protein n=1 Tax=Nitzschia inconspicua TaxID=303405 RepID=A0A9K3L6K2_9STRA|nr:anaphase-promoting complex subunit 11 RING-H2 finger-domain containing protein [Nitzschia inconspicua]
MFRLSPNRTVVTSFNPKTSLSSSSSSLGSEEYYEEGDWVLCVAAQPGSIACALSNGQLQLYDERTMHLVHTYERDNLLTELTFDTFQEHVLAATANDGSLTLFDIRQRNAPPAMGWKNMLRTDEEALTLSVGFDGNIAAVGSSKGKIHFFDVRSNKGILGSYTQAHTDEVTRVRFQSTGGMGTTRTTTSVLVSGSEDGLACVFDTSQPTEESAITNILPVQAPIRELGFFGPSMEAIYCLTGSESMQLYHKDESICRKDFGLQFRDCLNQQLVQNWATAMCGGKTSPISPMEYLVDCHWDMTRQELSLLTGSVKGDAALFLVRDHGVTPQHYLNGGHRGVIRAWHSCSNSAFLTVGEDARMCEWDHTLKSNDTTVLAMAGKAPQIIVPSRKRSGEPMQRGAGGGKLRRPRSRFTISPY